MKKKFKEWLAPPNDLPNGWQQARGREFERIIKRILEEEQLEPRGSLRPNGEEIDGTFHLEGRTFLLEAKWRRDPIPASDLYAFKGKVDGKLVGTIGVFISMSDYSKDAIDALKAGKDINLILFDSEDFILIEADRMSFREAMKRKLRYAAEEGQPYRPLAPDTAASTTGSLLDFMVPKEDVLVNTPEDTEVWDIVVEGRLDEVALRIIFHRIGMHEMVRIWPAGGQIGVPTLVRRLQESQHIRVGAIVDSDVPDGVRNEILSVLGPNPQRLMIVNPSLEDWMETAVSSEYANAAPPTSSQSKEFRRLALNADLQVLLQNPQFLTFLREITGDCVDRLLQEARDPTFRPRG